MVEVIVEPLLGHKVVVGAHLGDLTVLDDGDVVGIADGGEPMGDHNARPALLGPVQGFLDNLRRERKSI